MGLLFRFALEFVYLTLEGVDRFVHRLLEGFGLVAGHEVLARHMERDRCDLVSFFMVFIEFQNDLGTGRTLCEAVELFHFVLYEFDQPFVCVEFHGLNLYVHSLAVYKS